MPRAEPIHSTAPLTIGRVDWTTDDLQQPIAAEPSHCSLVPCAVKAFVEDGPQSLVDLLVPDRPRASIPSETVADECIHAAKRQHAESLGWCLFKPASPPLVAHLLISIKTGASSVGLDDIRDHALGIHRLSVKAAALCLLWIPGTFTKIPCLIETSLVRVSVIEPLLDILVPELLLGPERMARSLRADESSGTLKGVL